MTNDASILRLEDLAVGYGGSALFPTLSLEVQREQTWALLGRNGSGKTTLLRTILGLLPRVAGRVAWQEGVRVSYVPQVGDHDPAVPARAVDFIRSGLDSGWSFLRPGLLRSRRDLVRDVMHETRVEELACERFSELSAGQKQRVTLARALVSEPNVVILDEPTSSMDVVVEKEMFALLSALRQKHNLAVLVASHRMAAVTRFVDRAIFVDRDASIAVAGPVREVTESEPFLRRYGRLWSQDEAADVASPAH
jgi:zinc transport system ATP-binding protein